MLVANQLTLWRGHRCLFEQLDLTIEAGRAGIVRGPNGSGKTTLLRVLAGLTRPETGHVSWNGDDIERSRQAFAKQIAYLGHTTGLKADLTVQQNLDFARRLHGGPAGGGTATLAALELDDLRSLPVRYLSAGQQRRVALARLLSSPAKLWLMDEPLTNLDAAGRDFVSTCLNGHLKNGGLAVVATHGELDLPHAARVSLELGSQP